MGGIPTRSKTQRFQKKRRRGKINRKYGETEGKSLKGRKRRETEAGYPSLGSAEGDGKTGEIEKTQGKDGN